MSESDNYYRGRIEEELAAAERSPDPFISQIHREMAQRYRDRLNGQSDRLSDDVGMAWPAGGANGGTPQFPG